MKYAILSDIHANLEALAAVLEDIESQAVDRLLCLGDVVGYGPDPVECLRTLDRYEVTLMGNHELALLAGAGQFRTTARRAIEWTRRELKGSEQGRAYLDRIQDLPVRYQNDGLLCVHGAPSDPINAYLLPDAGGTSARLKPQFDAFDRYCFVGHTHIPGVLEPGRPFERPDAMLMNLYLLAADTKAIVNVGSVGQPRDHDPRACYVVLDMDEDARGGSGAGLVFRRVAYDVERTVDKINHNRMLGDVLGQRLRKGE